MTMTLVRPTLDAFTLTTGPEDADRVTAVFRTAVAAAEDGRCTTMFLTEEAVRLALPAGTDPLATLMRRYRAAGGTYRLCPLCVDAGGLDASMFVAGAEVGGSVPLWQWIQHVDGATAVTV